MHMRKILLGLGLLAAPMAMAHDGHHLVFGSAGLHGLLHPWLGLDHLLAMLGMGASLTALSRRATLGVSAAMLLLMLAGILSAQSVTVGDPLLAAALLITALLLLRDQQWAMKLRIGLVLAFSLLHGVAHGMAAPAEGSGVFALGVAGSSWLLFTIGMQVARHLQLQRRVRRVGLSGSLGLAALSLMFGI